MPKFEGIIFNASPQNGTIPIAINSVSSSNKNLKMMDQNILSPPTPQQPTIENDELNNSTGFSAVTAITKDSTPAQLLQWLNNYRLGQHVSTFASFSGADLLRMSKDDLIQICGLADGIRMYK